ncbi:MAG: hypothetical protein HKN13_00385 [Rhodothermales bacterium]|nr:hypothetical protein [Rhodothermales bacterium]
MNSVRDDFLLAAFGDLDDEYSVQLATHVENEYQAYCVIRFNSQCNRDYLERLKSEYLKAIAVLNSGDLQRERDRLVAHEKATTSKARIPGSRTDATRTPAAATAKTKLPADWKKQAKIVGKYEALSVVCSGGTEPAIRGDFFAALDDASDNQATELTAMIESSYDTQLAARQRAGKPCNVQMLQRLQRQYQGALTAVAGG